MKDLELLVSGIEYKVRKLTGQMNILKEELNRVELEKQSLEKVVREKRNEVKTLEEKIKLINVAKSIESFPDSIDFATLMSLIFSSNVFTSLRFSRTTFSRDCFSNSTRFNSSLRIFICPVSFRTLYSIPETNNSRSFIKVNSNEEFVQFHSKDSSSKSLMQIY